VAKFPEIVFESLEVASEGDVLRVMGVLTIRGVSRDAELEVTLLDEPGTGTAVGYVATASFDRQEFGVSYKHRDIPDFIGDEMTVEMHVLTNPAR
jgi:polyisoprenoid-binding protein YceI